MKKTNLSEYDPKDVPDGSNYRIAIVAARWNAEITDAMLDGAKKTLIENNTKEEQIEVYRVPGTFELPSAAQQVLRCSNVDAVICIGCVIQGETRHFDFICEAVSKGLVDVSLAEGKPVIFSVLTTNNMEQAKERAGGKHGNKGIEGAATALQMCELNARLTHKK